MEYPDPDEEYELMHADEFEAMRDLEEEIEDYSPPPASCKPKSKRSLDFDNSTSSKVSKTIVAPNTSDDSEKKNLPSCSYNSSSIPEDGCTPIDSAKRRISDLFGDIEDMEEEDDRFISNKKARLDEEAEIPAEVKQDMTIEKIISLRRRQQDFVNTIKSSSFTSRSKNVEDCMSRRVPQWPFMSVCGFGDQRIYLRLRSEESVDEEISRIASFSKSGGLLAVPYCKLYDMAKQELQKIKNGQKKNQEVPAQPNMDAGKDLWVSKYKPKNYLELLSDEGTNRSLLRWLKLWDKIVFNRNIPKTSHKDQNPKEWKNHQALTDDLDEHGRPSFKVALLCGPPGLGKTTLAHLIAVQAGYNVVEVNASDDRSPKVFRTQLEASTQMKAVMGEDRRPNCLILDEIDGAPPASIDVLIKFITDKYTEKKGKGKNKKAPGILRRPIICICNDVYVPALRPLRQIAFTLHFPPTSSARLAERLVEICRFEGVRTDVGSMMALGEKTNNDIRACLSVLHCIRSKGCNVTLSQIQNAKVGVKDMQQGLFTVWQKIFQITKPKTKVSHEGYTKNEGLLDVPADLRHDGTSFRYRMNEILRVVHGCGDYDKLAQGVFENFPALKSKSISIQSYALALKWFVFNDLVSTNIYTYQNFVLYPYLQYGFVVWHFIFATFSWPKINYPSVGYEVSQKVSRQKQLLDFCMQGMSPVVRSFVHRDNLLLDLVPYLLEIIVPNLRTVSSQLFTSKEKQELAHVVSTMIDYNLNYTQERTQDGIYNFNLDPNLEEVGRFSDWKTERNLSYSGKQMISREIDMEKMRRMEATLLGPKSNSNQCSAPTEDTPSAAAVTPQGKAKNASTTSHLQKLTPKALKKPVEKQVKDFFGRLVESKNAAASSKSALTDDIIKSDIWFHFKEGHNNAVRRTIYIKDLLKPPV